MRALCWAVWIYCLSAAIVTSSLEHATDLALRGFLRKAIDEFLLLTTEASPSVRTNASNCAALLSVVTQNQSSFDLSNYQHGGCRPLQKMYFTSAVVLQTQVHQTKSLSSMTCDDRVSIAVELENLDLMHFSVRHLEAALKSGTCGDQDLSIRLHSGLVCPSFFQSFDEIKWWRERIKQSIESVSSECASDESMRLSVKDLHSFTFSPAFELVYMGYDDSELMTCLNRMWSCVYPVLLSPPLVSKRENDGIKRIGFISSHFHRHSVCKLFCGVIERLDRSLFDVHIFFVGDSRDSWSQRLVKDSTSHRIPVGAVDLSTRNLIQNSRMDVLVYPAIGMDTTTSVLAKFRLAPVQVTTWGHPTTTGLSSIDYFVSSSLFHSSYLATPHPIAEQLVYFSSLGFYFNWPVHTNSSHHDVKALLPSQGLKVVCAQSIFKLHPLFVQAVLSLLESDSNLVLILLRDKDANRHRIFESKLRKLWAPVSDRVMWLPRLSAEQYLELMKQAYLVLDPFPFGGGVTTLEAFSMCTPVVTVDDLQSVPQLARGMYESMGIANAPVAHTVEEFLNFTLSLSENKSQRDLLSAHICEKQHQLFAAEESVSEWEQFLSKV